ncbi:MAG: hypothetical protein J5958_03905 [Clostridia bacterium]|nr:hypothetical protein [Clostridia bacterium]
MGFWKRNSYQIMRLFVIQIGIAIFGLVLSFAVSTAFRDRDDSAALLFVSVFSVLFYLFILYSVAWEIGGKDRLKLDAVHGKLHGGAGFVLALFAEVPNFLFACLMLIGGIISFSGSETAGARTFAVGYLPANFLESMYTGLIRKALNATHLVQDVSRSYYLVAGLFFLAATLPAILVIGFAYWMGLNEKRIIPSAKKPNPGDKN